MAIWLQTNLEAHPFVAPTYWQEKAFVRAALPKATLILAEEEDQIIGF